MTEAGKIVLEEFSVILQSYELLLEKLSHLDEDVAGELRLGVLYYDINFYISKICEVFRHKYPRMKLTLLSYQPRQLEEDLLNGKIDVALLYGAEDCRRRDIESLPLLKQQGVWGQHRVQVPLAGGLQQRR